MEGFQVYGSNEASARLDKASAWSSISWFCRRCDETPGPLRALRFKVLGFGRTGFYGEGRFGFDCWIWEELYRCAKIA